MESYMQERVNKICEDLKSLAEVRSIPLTGWKVKEGFFLTPEQARQGEQLWKDFDTVNDSWRGPDRHYWFHTEVEVPPELDGQPLWLAFATQATFWDAVNPQFLLFVNDRLIQGLDSNHREVALFGSAQAGERLSIDLQAYTGRDNDHNQGSTDNLRLFAQMVQPDLLVTKVYYHLNVPNCVVSRMEKDSQSRIRLQQALERAVNLLDLRCPRSPEFYHSVERCIDFTESEIYGRLAGNDEVIATCIGHTHIDVAWWWTVEQTREKVVRSFATVLKLMEEYPDYKFMSSQPQLYKFVKERYPELYSRIKQRVAEGRWEVEGAMWVEADCNVTSGESLVRQLLHGKRFFREEFGKENRILWLPDVFGYSAALPQLLKKSGVDYFMTTKIAWNQFNQLPCDTFFWRGIDGTEVFTHLITTQDANQREGSFFTTYNGVLEPVALMRGWERYQNKDVNNDILVAYGHGDGGGGPTRAMLENGARLAGGIAGAPKVRMESAGLYFEELYNRAATNPKLPRWTGELYLEYHRGTYTSMARNKRSNRRCEQLLQQAELYSVFAELVGAEYDAQTLWGYWETVLLNQFHDILPGSSIKEVYDVTKVEYAAIEQAAQRLITDKLAVIAAAGAREGQLVLFNSTSFARSGVAVVDVHGDMAGVQDVDGNRLPAQRTYDGRLSFVSDRVPANGWKAYTPTGEPCNAPPPITVSDSEIETPFYSLRLNDSGQLCRLYDKQAGRELIKPGQCANLLRVYEDKPIYYDNWDIDIYYTQKSWPVDELLESKWLENGEVRAVLQSKWRFLDSVIVQRMILYPDSRRIDFETYVDWKQHQLLLKCEFPVDINTNEATYDIQFGNVKRPTHRNTSWEAAQFEVCGHKWADLSEGGYGVALLNDCKYGYGITDGVITLSLIKSGVLPNPTTDQEEHFFTYALLPHMGALHQGEVHTQACCLNLPLLGVIAGAAKGHAKIPQALFDTVGDNIMVETVKQSVDEMSVIIRLYEYKNIRSRCAIKWYKAFTQAVECDLMEQPTGQAIVASDCIEFEIKPFEVKTFRVFYTA